jgi:putative transcriptional regulator
MKVFQHIVKIKEPPLLKAGTIIISQEFWNDEEFQRSVVLILQHNKKGSIGIFLNKLSNLKVKDALPDLNIKDDLRYGGPSAINKVGFLHQMADLPNAVKISESVYWGGNINRLQRMLDRKELDEKKVKFFAGFTEWGAGELLREINDNKWWIDHFSMDELLSTEHHLLWSNKLIESGNLYGVLFEVPDPGLN